MTRIDEQSAPYQQLLEGLTVLQIDPQKPMVERLINYVQLLLKWNRAYNLTAIRQPGDMIVKHLLDSLSIHNFIESAPCLDVGTGAGLPGIPLSILYPESRFILLDSNFKKIRFVRQVQVELELNNIELLNCRVEKLYTIDASASKVENSVDDEASVGEKPVKYRQIISRAFSSLKNMTEVCYPLLEPGGTLLAMKGKVTQQELDELTSAYPALTSIKINQVEVPFLDEARHIVCIK